MFHTHVLYVLVTGMIMSQIVAALKTNSCMYVGITFCSNDEQLQTQQCLMDLEILVTAQVHACIGA